MLFGLVLAAVSSLSVLNASIIDNSLYYSYAGQYQYAVSVNNFYATVEDCDNSLGYKSIDDDGNQLNSIDVSPSGAVIRQVAAFASGEDDDIWAIGADNNLYCGSVNDGLVQADLSDSPFSQVSLVAVGPSGVWVADLSGNLFNNASSACNSGSSWVAASVPAVCIISAGQSGVYFKNANGIFQLASPSSSPQPLPSNGPASVSFMSASQFDDSVAAVDGSNNVWILNGPSGNWMQTSLVNSVVVNNDIDNLYVYYADDSGNMNVNHVTFGASKAKSE